jgi:hypothetical protein
MVMASPLKCLSTSVRLGVRGRFVLTVCVLRKKFGPERIKKRCYTARALAQLSLASPESFAPEPTIVREPSDGPEMAPPTAQASSHQMILEDIPSGILVGHDVMDRRNDQRQARYVYWTDSVHDGCCCAATTSLWAPPRCPPT